MSNFFDLVGLSTVSRKAVSGVYKLQRKIFEYCCFLKLHIYCIVIIIRKISRVQKSERVIRMRQWLQMCYLLIIRFSRVRYPSTREKDR